MDLTKSDSSTISSGKPEADADSIEIKSIQIGDFTLAGPVSLSAEADVKEEVRRILRLAKLPLDPNDRTFVVTSSDGQQVWLQHGEVIEDKLDDLTAPLYVEIVRFGDQPRGLPPNVTELNVVPKE